MIGAAVLLLLDAENVRGALVACEQALAVVGSKELAQRLDAADDEEKVVLPFSCQYGVDKIMTRALLAKLDLEAVEEE